MSVNGSFRRELAINALLQTSTLTEAGRVAKLSTKTLHRYLSEPSFLEALEERKRQYLNAALDHLIVNSKSMAEVLTSVAVDSMSPPSAKCSAAFRALQIVLEAKQIAELERKVLEIERRTIDQKPQWSGPDAFVQEVSQED